MKKLIPLILIVSILLCGCVEITVQMPTQPQPSLDPDSTGNNMLTVHYIDVGQADCALIETDGKYVLIDGGNREDGQLVVSYLQEQGVEELEAVICSHAHEDHVGGLPSVLAVFPAKAVYSPTKTYSSEVYDDFLYYTDQQGLEVTIPEPGDEFIVGQARFTVLGPTKSYAETNETSISVLLEHLNIRFLSPAIWKPPRKTICWTTGTAGLTGMWMC